MLADELDYVPGVDTHRDEHVLAVVTAPAGAVIAGKAAHANARGYRELLRVAKQPHRHALESPNRERQHRHGRPIQPLHVVDDDEEIAPDGHLAKELQDTARECVLVDHIPRSTARQRSLHGDARRTRQTAQFPCADRVEQVPQPCVREIDLRRRRPGHQCTQRERRRGIEGRSDDCRLADLGFPHDDETSRPVAGPEQLAEHSELGLAAGPAAPPPGLPAASC